MSPTGAQTGRIGPAGAERTVESQSAFGRLLREWRARRRVSQLDLAVEAGVSSRHVSFIETGRAQPSREMVLMLARVLDVPLRDRNDLLMAAGYAAMYCATDLDAPALEQARRAFEFMLRQQEPYPAIVVDRHWTILKANGGAVRLVEAFADPSAMAEWGGNAMRLMFHPRGFRPHIVNWEAIAAALIQWLHRDVLSGLGGTETRGLLDELLSYPGVPPRWRRLDLDASTAVGPSPPPSLARRREAVAHRGSQIQDLDGRLRDQVVDLVRERLFTPSIENRRQGGPWTQSDIARSGSTRHHPIPKSLTLQP